MNLDLSFETKRSVSERKTKRSLAKADYAGDDLTLQPIEMAVATAQEYTGSLPENYELLYGKSYKVTITLEVEDDQERTT